MPTKPKTFRPAGAPTRQASRAAYDQRRGSAHQRGYTKEWSKLSKWWLNHNPICVRCKAETGRIVQAEVTDHIKPIRYFPELAYDPANLQSLCVRHNAIKSHEDERKHGQGYPQGGVN